jgi:hypothetical protein
VPLAGEEQEQFEHAGMIGAAGLGAGMCRASMVATGVLNIAGHRLLIFSLAARGRWLLDGACSGGGWASAAIDPHRRWLYSGRQVSDSKRAYSGREPQGGCRP